MIKGIVWICEVEKNIRSDDVFFGMVDSLSNETLLSKLRKETGDRWEYSIDK